MRQFIVEKGKEKNGLIQLDGKDYRYLRQVLRVRNGDMISVRLPDGELKNATVSMVDEAQRRVTLQICADTGFNGAEEKSITRGVQADEAESSGTSFGFSSSLNAFLAEKPEYNGVVEKFWVSKSIAHYVKQLRQESSPGAVFTSVLLITTIIK